MTNLTNNVQDVALIFEGGGMRNSYSSGACTVLLEHEIFFSNAYGLSAGATNAIDYLSRDRWRTRVSFTEFADDFDFRTILHPFLELRNGKLGTDHSAFAKAEQDLPFDFETFRKNPANLTLQAIDRDTGATEYFTQNDFSSKEALFNCVRASTSYPLLMSPTRIAVHYYYDGGIGEGGGIMLPRAREDGFKRFFVVCTRPRGFRKPLKRNYMYDILFWRRPCMRKALNSWAWRYNAELDELERLEKEGRAYVFYATNQSVMNTERNKAKLEANYQRGYDQALSELATWKAFLGL